MAFKNTVKILTLAISTLYFSSCSNLSCNTNEMEASEENTISGIVEELTKKDLNYVDRSGFGSSNNIPIELSFLEILTSDSSSYQLLLSGPHNIKEGNKLNINYIADPEITGVEIWERMFPENKIKNSMGNLVPPNITFSLDGQVTKYKRQ